MAIVDDEILITGADAMKSQYEVRFPAGIPGNGNTRLLTLRQEGSFDPPSKGVQVYDVFRRGQKVPKPGAAEEEDKTFTLTFRLDQNWIVYDAINAWAEVCYNSINGTPGNTRNARATVEVVQFDESERVVKTYTFFSTFISARKPAENDHTAADHLTLEVTFHYARGSVR